MSSSGVRGALAEVGLVYGHRAVACKPDAHQRPCGRAEIALTGLGHLPASELHFGVARAQALRGGNAQCAVSLDAAAQDEYLGG